jgi:hypothetical protein
MQKCRVCRAGSDAYSHLYGLTRDELCYILDLKKEVYGEDFTGETFRVLKEKEIRQFGEDGPTRTNDCQQKLQSQFIMSST